MERGFSADDLSLMLKMGASGAFPRTDSETAFQAGCAPPHAAHGRILFTLLELTLLRVACRTFCGASPARATSPRRHPRRAWMRRSSGSWFRQRSKCRRRSRRRAWRAGRYPGSCRSRGG